MRISGLVVVLLLMGGRVALGEGKTITVASDGTGDVKTVQEALAGMPEKSADRTIIAIKPGKYKGPIVVRANKPRVTFKGEDSATTILTYDRNVQDAIPEGSDKFNPGVQVMGDDFRAENVTFENTSGDHGQALALRMDGDRAVLKNCRLTGWQDTLMINTGRDYLENCYIEGRVDFIYGSATAVFENCEIHSKNGGYLTAANTPADHPYGFVFMHCKLTGEETAWNPATTNPATTQAARKASKWAELGRPWRAYASVTFLECEMGDHIKPNGWNNWRNPENEKTARYSEYNSSGPGAAPSKRVAWSHQLTKEEADKITIESVLSGSDGWKPER